MGWWVVMKLLEAQEVGIHIVNWQNFPVITYNGAYVLGSM